MQIVKHLQGTDLLPKGGRALDVGPKYFKDSISLVEAGFIVDAIEPDLSKGTDLKDINVIRSTLEEAELDKYDVIIARNVLPSVQNYWEHFDRLVKALKPSGVMFFNVWGPRHEWREKLPVVENKKFAENKIQDSKLNIMWQQEMEGLVPTYAGVPTYWHDYSFIVQK
jgi:hypothetical protein